MNTMQQEFDAVVAHLYKQRRPANIDDGLDGPGCYYRIQLLGETLSCAVGCRIPDAVYTVAMDKPNGSEGSGIDSLLKNFGDVLPKELSAYRGLFEQLQMAHDGANVYPSGEFKFAQLEAKLRAIATAFELDFTAPVVAQ